MNTINILARHLFKKNRKKNLIPKNTLRHKSCSFRKISFIKTAAWQLVTAVSQFRLLIINTCLTIQSSAVSLSALQVFPVLCRRLTFDPPKNTIIVWYISEACCMADFRDRHCSICKHFTGRFYPVLCQEREKSLSGRFPEEDTKRRFFHSDKPGDFIKTDCILIVVHYIQVQKLHTFALSVLCNRTSHYSGALSV